MRDERSKIKKHFVDFVIRDGRQQQRPSSCFLPFRRPSRQHGLHRHRGRRAELCITSRGRASPFLLPSKIVPVVLWLGRVLQPPQQPARRMGLPDRRRRRTRGAETPSVCVSPSLDPLRLILLVVSLLITISSLLCSFPDRRAL